MWGEHVRLLRAELINQGGCLMLPIPAPPQVCQTLSGYVSRHLLEVTCATAVGKPYSNQQLLDSECTHKKPRDLVKILILIQ